jgi:hypothetical protein
VKTLWHITRNYHTHTNIHFYVDFIFLHLIVICKEKLSAPFKQELLACSMLLLLLSSVTNTMSVLCIEEKTPPRANENLMNETSFPSH